MGKRAWAGTEAEGRNRAESKGQVLLVGEGADSAPGGGQLFCKGTSGWV